MPESRDLFPFNSEPPKKRKPAQGPDKAGNATGSPAAKYVGRGNTAPSERRENPTAPQTIQPASPSKAPVLSSENTLLESPSSVQSENRHKPAPQGTMRHREKAASIISEMAVSKARGEDLLAKPVENLTSADRARLSDTLQAFREERTRDPDNVDLLWRMFQVQRALGMESEARLTLCDIIRLEPHNEHARRALARMCSAEEIAEFRLPVPPRPFYSDPADFFLYPFAKGGVFTIVGGCIVFSFLQLIIMGSMLLGPIGIACGSILGALFYGYILSFYYKIVKTSAEGQDYPPDWPDFAPLEMLETFAKTVALAAICLAPSAVWIALCRFAVAPFSETAATWMTAVGLVPCMLFAIYYGVVGLVGLSVFKSWEYVYHIPNAIRSALRTLPELALVSLMACIISGTLVLIFGAAYVILALCLGGTISVLWKIDTAIMTGVAIAGALALLFLFFFSFFYTAMVVSRVFGLFYRQVERKFA